MFNWIKRKINFEKSESAHINDDSQQKLEYLIEELEAVVQHMYSNDDHQNAYYDALCNALDTVGTSTSGKNRSAS